MELGSKTRDKATGVHGTVTARIEYLGGETQYRLEYVDSVGRIQDVWLPLARLAD